MPKSNARARSSREPTAADVLAYFESSGRRPLKLRDLARALAVPRAGWPLLRNLVQQLESEGRLRRGPNRRFQPSSAPSDSVVGRLQGVRAGGAFILRDGAPDVYVRAGNQGTALHGDIVQARLRRVRGRVEGIVEKVVRPARAVVAGTLEFDGAAWFLVPDEARIGRDLNLSASAIQPQAPQRGHKALVRVRRAGTAGELHGDIVTILGPADRPGVRSQALVAEFDLAATFPDDVLAAVEDLRPPTPAECAARDDLSQLVAFTIDPVDARDHDDAVSIERLAGGGFELGVHIADVAWYVRPNSAVDTEGERRGTSVYLADRVVPMLPEMLSNHICSLRPGVPRFVLSAFIQFGVDGAAGKTRFAAGWIASRAKLSYAAAEALLAGSEPDAGHVATHSSEESGEPPWPGARPWPEMRPAITAALTDMRHLSRLLRARRFAAGSLGIDTPEFKVVHDAQGRVARIDERTPLESYGIIEEFMLAANQAVARALARARLPLLWRVHEVPDGAKVEDLRLFLKKLGIVWTPRDPAGNDDYQHLLKTIDRRPERKYLMFRILRSLQKARYDARHIGHFGLAFDDYTHFTSPIRRYPDLYVHRLLRVLLGAGRRGEDDGARTAGGVRELGVHTSERELVAAEAERASLKLHVCEWLQDHVGETTEGYVSAVADHGLYVDLPEWRAEGLVHVSRMTDDIYEPDLHRTRLVGVRTRRAWQFGQAVRVRLLRADPDRRQIDLALEHGGGTQLAPSERLEGRRARKLTTAIAAPNMRRGRKGSGGRR
jgi:ribonuclease R